MTEYKEISFKTLSREEITISCANIGIVKEQVAKIIGITPTTFMHDKKLMKLYDEHLSKTVANFASFIVNKAKEDKNLALKILQVHGKWIERKTTELENYKGANYQKAMDILDEALECGKLGIDEYALLAKVRIDRLGAEEIIKEVKEIKHLTDELIEQNRNLKDQNGTLRSKLHLDVTTENNEDLL